ncbi:flavin reductase [Nocardioides baekrokdamisoli]|uniref:Flavin reductase n=1 Tax=Nocardioides baekrokdamisoli TaxID=1804624 RepID=A0A3G9IXG5_9ACTN|nr:flavin reductase family protein [Nocardioides baekrokdamisoli]BBH18391.1 flavin reductase [Nocardioides baekrokdamisoli]
MSQTDPVVEKNFRAAMSHVAAPVSIVTSVVDGTPWGTTVSAFASLSMDPPMMLISLQHDSGLLSRIGEGSILGVNVLSASQSELALRFARRDQDRFTSTPWTLADGAPRLGDIHAYVAVKVARMVTGGDHVVLFCDVIDAATYETQPLTYHRRLFGTHTPEV